MKIISHFNAITLTAATWDEVRPVTGVGFGATQQVMKERYKFQVATQSALSQQVGIMTPSFTTGQFKIGDNLAPVNQLEFQPQAVLVSCATTEQTIKVFDDVFSFLHQTLQYRIPPKGRERHYVTTIIVDFETPISPLFEKWSKIQKTLSAAVGSDVTPFSIRFGPMANVNPLVPEKTYVFERRAITPAGEHWYFSQAPLDTDAHLALLSEINAAIGH